MAVELLRKLHQELSEAMLEEVQAAREEGMPIPAADKGAIIKFLKDNGVTADPANQADLEELQAALRQSHSERRTALQGRLEDVSEEAVRALYDLH